eukprot:GHRR01032520.1.p2 GENE.GHRR01032520.1~~GHRR01032520.1.p2  ORF type:complete len:141 (+),score=27.35 GHRR01032520.1:209-631(+)
MLCGCLPTPSACGERTISIHTLRLVQPKRGTRKSLQLSQVISRELLTALFALLKILLVIPCKAHLQFSYFALSIYFTPGNGTMQLWICYPPCQKPFCRLHATAMRTNCAFLTQAHQHQVMTKKASGQATAAADSSTPLSH